MAEYIADACQLKRVLSAVAESGKLASFRDAEAKNEFVVMRHDVEYSLEKALEMAQAEHEYGIRAAYFIQTRCSAYNPFAQTKSDVIREISRLGHDIGLHYRQEIGSREKNELRIKEDAAMLEDSLQVPVRLYSTHMPDQNTEYDRYHVEGMLNAYAQPFFLRFGQEGRRVLYISDSALEWNYGFPDAETLRRNPRIQILIHPYGWSVQPQSKFDTFRRLAASAEKEAWELYTSEFPGFRGMHR